MNQNPFKSVFAVTLFCEDLQASSDFYEKFLEHQAVFETETSRVFKIGDLLINLLVEGSVPELIEPEVWGKSGQNDVFTVHVDELDSEIKRLERHGFEFLNGPILRPWGIRALTIQDPDGHIWEVAQEL
jgi:catechol 2,3-dioxygenase-like lactoylglutathione lyase family enzyme